MVDQLQTILTEALSWLKPEQSVFLATLDGSQPKVRPVTLIYFLNSYWVVTFAGDAKVNQISRNPSCEFCLMVQEGAYQGYIRGTGTALIVADPVQRALLSENVSFFSHFFATSTDPEFSLLNLKITSMEYMRPGETKAHHLLL